MNAFVRLAALGILAGCASRPPAAARVTVAPLAAGSVTPVAGVLEQNAEPKKVEEDPGAKSSCAGAP